MTAKAKRQIPVRNPRTGKTDFMLEVETSEDVSAKAKKLRQAQIAWGELELSARIEIMFKWEKSLREHARLISAADAEDTGYNRISQIAPIMAANMLHGVCKAAPAQYSAALRQGTSYQMPSIRYDCVLKPYPIVGIISPWNGPTWLTLMHMILPLVAGCAVLVKPSEVTPRFAKPIMDSLKDIPLLCDVVAFVNGDAETGQALVANSDKVSFTGSVPVGRKVAEACASRFIPCELELGGKDPLIITRNANIEDAVSAALRGGVNSTGQVCFALERIYVAREIHDEFVEKLIERAQKIEVNYPDPMSGHIGPFTFAKQAQIVDSHIEDALAKGANLKLGGKSFELGGGLYMKPTILTNVNHEMLIMQDETFGPVIPIMAFDNDEEAIRLANDTIFGLSAAVIAGSEEEALKIARRVNAGNISVQDAYLTFVAAPAESDAYGASGLGGKRTGIQRYLRRQALLINSAKPACLLDELMQAV